MTPVTPRHFCVAGVALGDIHFRSAWQAWHKVTSTVVLCGRRGTDGTGWRAWTGLGARDARDAAPLLRGQAWDLVTSTLTHVAGVAQLHIHGRFAWEAWHNLTSTVLSRGRRGTTSHLPSFCVAGVVHMALGGALGLGLGARDARDAAPLLRGRRGTW